MQDSEYLVDDGEFRGIFTDIDRSLKATQQKLRAMGIEPSDPRFAEYTGKVEDAVISDRKKFLYDEALQAGRPQEYAEYRSSAYAAGRSVMPFDVWSKKRRHAAEAEISDFMGRVYVVGEGSAASTVGGTATWALNQFGEASQYRYNFNRYQELLKVRDQILYRREVEWKQQEKRKRIYDNLPERPAGEEPSFLENFSMVPFYKDQVKDEKYKTKEEIEKEFPIHESITRQLAELQPTADMYGQILLRDYMTGQAIKEEVVGDIRSFAQSLPPIDLMGYGVRQLANPSDPSDTSLISDEMQDTTGVGKFLGDVVGTTMVSAPALYNPIFLAPFFPMGYQGGQERLMNNYARERRRAELLGLEEPEAPYARLREAGYIGGTSEILSEGVGNFFEKAILLNRLWRNADTLKKGERAARSMPPSQFKRLADDLVQGAYDAKHGSKGLLAGAAKRVVRGGSTVKRYAPRVVKAGLVEAFEEVANETVLSIGVDSMTGSHSFSTWFSNSLHAGLVASVSSGGTSAVILGKNEAEYQRIRSEIERLAEEQFGKGWNETVDKDKAEALITSAIKASADSHAMRRTATAIPYAYGEKMALRQVDQYTSSNRLGILVDKAAKGVTITPAVKDSMTAAGIDAENPIAYGDTLIYTSAAMAPQVAAAYENGEIEKIDGTLAFAGSEPTGIAYVEDKSGSIIEVIPATRTGFDNNDPNDPFYTWKQATLAEGHKVEYAEGERAAQIADTINAQVDTALGEQGKPPIDFARNRPANLARGVRRLRGMLDSQLKKEVEQDAVLSANDPSHKSMLSDLGFDPAQPVSVEVKLSAVSNKRMNDDERRISSMGMGVAVLEGHLQWKGKDKNGKNVERKTAIPQKGLYAAQASADGLFLLRDEKGTAFNFRNAWATVIHEAMHRNVARSRGGARWLNMLFSMAPEENIVEALKAMRNYKEFGSAEMTDAELMNEMIARYEAAQMVMGDAAATEEERTKAREDLGAVARFGEEVASNVVESRSGAMSAHAAAYVMAYQYEKGLSLMKFAGYLAHTLVKNGYSGPTAKAIHDMMIQRANGVREAELKLDSQYRDEARARYESALRREMEWRKSLQERGAKGERYAPPVEQQQAEEVPAPESATTPPVAPAMEGESAAPMASMRKAQEAAPPTFAAPETAVPPDEDDEAEVVEPTRRDRIVAGAMALLKEAIPYVSYATMPKAQVVPPVVTERQEREEMLRKRAPKTQEAAPPQIETDEVVTPETRAQPMVRATAVAETASLYETEYMGVMSSFREAPRLRDTRMTSDQQRWLSAKGKNRLYRPTEFDKRTGMEIEGEATVLLHGTATPDGKPWEYFRPSEFGRWGRGVYLWKDEGGALDWARKTMNDNRRQKAIETKPVVIRTIARLQQPYFIKATDRNAVVASLRDPRNAQFIRRQQQRLEELADAFDYSMPRTDEVRDRQKQAIKDDFVDILMTMGFDGMVVENSARPTDYDDVVARKSEPRRGELTVSEIVVWDPSNIKDVNNKSPKESIKLMASMRPVPMVELPTGTRKRLKNTVLHDKAMDEVGVVYHGTNARDEFTKFAEEKMGVNTGAASAKQAFFFSDNPDVASGYAMADAVVSAEDEAASPISPMNEEMMREQAERAEQAEPFAMFDEDEQGWVPYLRYTDRYGTEVVERVGGVRGPSYQNEVEADNVAFDEKRSMIADAYGRADKAREMKDATVSERATNARVMPSMLAMRNPLVHDFKGESWREQSFTDLIQQAKEEGRDGVVFKNVTDPAVDKPWASVPSNVYAVFKANQIVPALAFNTAQKSEYMASMRQPIDLSERPKTTVGQPRYSQNPFTPRLLKIKDLLRDHIVNGTPLVGVPPNKPVAIKDWLNWMQKNGMNTSHLRWSLPWLFKNRYGMPIQRATRDRAAERAAKEQRRLAEEEAAKQGKTLKPLPEPLGQSEKLTALEMLAELDAAVPWTYVPTYLGINRWAGIRGNLQQIHGDNIEVGMVLSPRGQEADLGSTLTEIASTANLDPKVAADVARISTSVLEAMPLRDVVAARMDTKFVEGHWHLRNLLMHYRYTRITNPAKQGDIFADELQSTYRAHGQKVNGDTDQYYFPEIRDPNNVVEQIDIPDGKWNVKARLEEVPLLRRSAIAAEDAHQFRANARNAFEEIEQGIRDSVAPYETIGDFVNNRGMRGSFTDSLKSAAAQMQATMPTEIASALEAEIVIQTASGIAADLDLPLFGEEGRTGVLIPATDPLARAYQWSSRKDIPAEKVIEAARKYVEESESTSESAREEVQLTRDERTKAAMLDAFLLANVALDKMFDPKSALAQVAAATANNRKMADFIMDAMPLGVLDVAFMNEKWEGIDWASIAEPMNRLAEIASQRLVAEDMSHARHAFNQNRGTADYTATNSMLADEEAVRLVKSIADKIPQAKDVVIKARSAEDVAAEHAAMLFERPEFKSYVGATVLARTLTRTTGKEHVVTAVGIVTNGVIREGSGAGANMVAAPRYQVTVKQAQDEYRQQVNDNLIRLAEVMDSRSNVREALNDITREANQLFENDQEIPQEMKDRERRLRVEYSELNQAMYSASNQIHDAMSAQFRRARELSPALDAVVNTRRYEPVWEQVRQAFVADMTPVLAPIIQVVRDTTTDDGTNALRSLIESAATVGGMNVIFKRGEGEQAARASRYQPRELMYNLRNQDGTRGEDIPFGIALGPASLQIGDEVVLSPNDYQSRPLNLYYENQNRPDLYLPSHNLREVIQDARRHFTGLVDMAKAMRAVTPEQIDDDTNLAKSTLSERLSGAAEEERESVVRDFRLSARSSLVMTQIARYASGDHMELLKDRLFDSWAADVRNADAMATAANPRGLAIPAPLTHELKDNKGALISDDFQHALFAGLVRDVFGHGGDVGSSVVFPLPNDTGTNSMMAPLAAASYYGWDRDEAIIEIWENLKRGGFDYYIDAQGRRLSNGPYEQTQNRARSEDWVIDAQNKAEKQKWGNLVVWLESVDPDGTVVKEEVDVRGQYEANEAIQQYVRQADGFGTVAQYLSFVERQIQEMKDKHAERLRNRSREYMQTQEMSDAEREEITEREVAAEMQKLRVVYAAGQVERLYGGYAKAMDEQRAAFAEQRERKVTKGILRGKLEAWAKEYGGTVKYEVYPNTDGKPRMQLVIDQMLKDTATVGFPMASMRRGLAGGFDAFYQQWVDKYEELGRYVEQERRRRGGRLPDTHNPYQGARVLSGRIASRQADMKREYATILRDMHEMGVTTEIMDTFLLAQHAKERNEEIASRNPAMPDGGSGMFTIDARDILDNARANGTFAALDGFAKRWRDLLRRHLDTRVDSGLMTEEQRKLLEDRWKFYVPLRGKPMEPFDDDFADAQPSGGTGSLSTASRGMPTALGRESMAEAITSQIGFVAEDTLSRAERNNIGNRFLNLVLSVNDVSMAEVITPTKRALVNGVVRPVYDFQWSGNPRNFGLYLNRDTVINGESYSKGDLVVIKINNPRLATAMGKAVDVGLLRSVLETPNNIFRSVTTGLFSPVFMSMNMIRDFSMGALRNYADRGVVDTAQMIKGYAPAAWNIFVDEWMGKGPTREYREYVEAGGDMAWGKPNDLETKAVEFKKLEAQVAKRDPNQTALRDYLFGWYPALFKTSETAMRLSHYKQRVAKGATPEQAALSARNLTIDFARGGTLKPIFNTMYVYMNAGIQGTDATFKALKDAKELAPALVGAGFFTSMLARACAGVDPKTGINRWDMIADYEKAASIHLFMPNQSGYGIKIPQPYGFNVMFTLGQDIADMMFGPKTRAQLASNTIDNSLNFLNPFGGSGVTKGMENMVTFAFPTLLRFYPELAQNTDFANRPIYPENKFGPETSQAHQAFDSTPEMYRWFAEKANEYTGGNEIDSGFIDFHPDSMEYMIGFIFSGAGRAVQRTVDVATGEKPISEAPFVRNFTVTPDAADKFAVAEFYKLRDDLAKEVARAKEMAKGQQGRNLGTFDKLRYTLALEAKEIDSQIKEIRKAMKSTTNPEAIAVLQKQRLDLMKYMVSRYYKLTAAK